MPHTDTPLHSLSTLGGGGFGGFWPAKIWNTFAQAEFGNLPVQSFQTPQFSGQKWNLLGPLPKAKPKPKPKCTTKFHGRMIPIGGKGCPAVTPTATPSNPFPGGGGFPTSTATPTPTTSVTGTPTPTTSGTATATPTAPSTGFGGGGGGGFGANTAQTASGVKAGMAVGGALAVLLPGSLLWTTGSRRRRKRRAVSSR